MVRQKRSRNTHWLAGLVLVAIAYCALIAFQAPDAGVNKLLGMLGVLLGLFIGAQPIANFLELLLFPNQSGLHEVPRSILAVWFSANLLALLAGWFVIMVGAIRYTTA